MTPVRKLDHDTFELLCKTLFRGDRARFVRSVFVTSDEQLRTLCDVARAHVIGAQLKDNRRQLNEFTDLEFRVKFIYALAKHRELSVEPPSEYPEDWHADIQVYLHAHTDAMDVLIKRYSNATTIVPAESLWNLMRIEEDLRAARERYQR